jgi:hypothetical protein
MTVCQPSADTALQHSRRYRPAAVVEVEVNRQAAIGCVIVPMALPAAAGTPPPASGRTVRRCGPRYTPRLRPASSGPWRLAAR